MSEPAELYDAILTGNAKKAEEVTKAALAANVNPSELLGKYMIPAMDEVGKRFECNEYFVPELLIAARAMKISLELITPLLAEVGAEPVGRVVIGTVQGDLHDIGKNLVAMMLKGAGFEVIDLGVDVAPEKFAAEAKARGVNLIGMSALLTTTMPGMEKTIKALQQAGLKVKVMVGGAPAAFEKVKPILLNIGPKVNYVGENGLAVTTKIATNLSLAVQMLAFSEGVLIAEKSGIRRETAVEVLLNSVIASPMVKYRGPFVLEMPEEAWFSVNMMQKDMNLALELGQQLDIPLPTTAVTNEFLTAARGLGLEKQDFAVLFKVLANLSGVSQ